MSKVLLLLFMFLPLAMVFSQFPDAATLAKVSAVLAQTESITDIIKNVDDHFTQVLKTAEKLAVLPQSVLNKYLKSQEESWQNFARSIFNFEKTSEDMANFTNLDWSTIPTKMRPQMFEALNDKDDLLTSHLWEVSKNAGKVLENSGEWANALSGKTGYGVPISNLNSDLAFLQNISEQLEIQLGILREQTVLLSALVAERATERQKEKIADDSALKTVNPFDKPQYRDLLETDVEMDESILGVWETKEKVVPWIERYRNEKKR